MGFDDLIQGRLVVSTITVATTETALPTTATAGRKAIIITNNGSATIFVGPTGVTTSTGTPILAGASLPLDLGEKVIIYGIVATGTENARILEGV